MKITEFSIHNPILVLAITFAVAIFGIGAYTSFGVALIPNVNFPQVIVTTIYPGADPESVEADVTRPIEDALATLPNIDTNGLTSISAQGVSTVVVQFTSSVNMDIVSLDVQRMVNSIRNRLPSDIESPTISKVDANAGGVATIVFSGQQPLTVMQDFAENVLQKQFNALPGVGAANLRSGIVREVHVKVDQNALWARGMSINDVVNGVQASQLEVPAGSISQNGRDFSVYFDALARSPQGLDGLVLSETATGPVYLRDVATVEDTFKKRDAIVRVNGQEGLAIVIVKLADANTIAVVDQARKAMVNMEPLLPPGTHLDMVIDYGRYTQLSFDTVQHALVEAILMTGLILLLFLHTWRSTAIVLVSIPTSLLVTLTAMSMLGYNLNLITMMALTLCVGILVDDSIVVLENIARHLGMGKPGMRAAIDGRSEIGLAAVTITLVDVVVYLPMAIVLTGISAQFLRPFAITIAIATLTSLLISFTLTPLLASRFLAIEAPNARGPLAVFGRAWDRGFDWIERRYAGLLRVSLPRRWIVIGVGMATFALGISLWFLNLIGTDFFPSGDQSEIDITVTMPPSTSLATTNQASLQIERILHGYEEVTTTYAIIGQTAGFFGEGTGSNTTQITALLVHPSERKRPSVEIGAELQEKLVTGIPGAKIEIGLPNAFGFGGFGGQPIQVQVQGIDPVIVNQIATQVEDRIRGVPGAVAITNSNENRQTQIRATADWVRAADLGVSPQNAGAALRAAIDGFKSNFTQLHQTGKTAVDIRVLDANSGVATVEDIRRLPVSGTNGTVQLGQFTTIREVEIPTRINHVNRLRSVTIGTEPGNGLLVGTVQTAVQAALQGMELAPGYQITYAGQGQQGGSAIAEIGKALGAAVLLMYMLMMVLFGSLTIPLAVLMSLPLAVVGAFGLMAITHTPFTLFSMLGFAVLVGLVGKNAILLVDFTEILRARGYTRMNALLEAGPTRLRPIVMTTISVMAALLPIGLGLEEGSELLKAAAIVLIGGLATSTLLTLVFVPAMYTIFDDSQHLFGRVFHGIGHLVGRLTRPRGLSSLPAVSGGSNEEEA